MKARFLILLLLAGCVSVGRKIDTQALAQIHKDQTTKTEVLNLLGSPDTYARMGDGTELLQYMFVRSVARPETYIPVVGAFAAGADTQMQHVLVRIDSGGIVRDFTMTESAGESRSGAMVQPGAQLPQVQENKRPAGDPPADKPRWAH